jgi:uncharacterized protein YciI
MSEWLYRIQPARPEMLTAGPTEDEARLVGEHFAYLERLLAEGTVLLAGRTLNDDASTFGLVIYRAPDEAAARAVMEGDPAVRAGVMRAELFPYRVALMARG